MQACVSQIFTRTACAYFTRATFELQFSLRHCTLSILPILRPHKIRERLRVARKVMRSILIRMSMRIVMPMRIVVAVRRTHILEHVDRAALRTTLNWAVSGCRQPNSNVAVCWRAGAADVLLVTEGFDWDGVVECACLPPERLDSSTLCGRVHS